MQRSGRIDYRSIGLLLISGVGLALSLVIGLVLVIIGLTTLFGESAPLDEVLPVFTAAWIAGLVALLALPAVIFSVLRLLGRSPHMPNFINGWRLANIAIILWPLVLVLGNAVAGSRLAWLVMPPLQLLAVGLPIWWLIEMARRRLPGGSAQRAWGILNVSMLVTTPVVVVVELLGMLGLIIVVGVVISSRPEWAAAVEQLAQRLSVLQDNPAELVKVIQPLLQHPIVVYAALGLIAGVVPLVEEMLKPLAVWLLAGRSISPAEGFVAGAISGGAFALIESLMTLSGSQGSAWAGLAVARAGTGLLHITTTAFIGWALANAWRNSAFGRLGLAYLVAVTWHGLWNGLSAATVVAALISEPAAELVWLVQVANIAPFALIALVICLFFFLWFISRSLRGQRIDRNTAFDQSAA